MAYSHASEAPKKLGKEVSLRGWVYRKRESGGIIFIIIRDRTGTIQASIKKDNVDAKTWKAAQDAIIESSVELKGSVKKDERALWTNS